MTRPEMSLDRFRALLDAYGTHWERWPAAERGAARALVLNSPQARSTYDECAALDALLDAAAPAPLPAALEMKLFAIPQKTKQALPFRGRALWMPAIGWAAAAAIGIWAGSQFSGDAAGDTRAATAAVESETGGEDDSQFLELAGGLELGLESP